MVPSRFPSQSVSAIFFLPPFTSSLLSALLLVSLPHCPSCSLSSLLHLVPIVLLCSSLSPAHNFFHFLAFCSSSILLLLPHLSSLVSSFSLVSSCLPLPFPCHVAPIMDWHQLPAAVAGDWWTLSLPPVSYAAEMLSDDVTVGCLHGHFRQASGMLGLLGSMAICNLLLDFIMSEQHSKTRSTDIDASAKGIPPLNIFVSKASLKNVHKNQKHTHHPSWNSDLVLQGQIVSFLFERIV